MTRYEEILEEYVMKRRLGVLTLVVNACKQAVIGELLANDIEGDAESRDAAFLIKEFIAEVVSLLA